MSTFEFLQILIASLFGLSVYLKMWKHSISVFTMLMCGTLSLFIYKFYPNIATVCFSMSAIYVTLRGALKPQGDTLWI